MYFPNYGAQNTWFDKCLKSPISEHPLTLNMLKSSKHWLNMHDSTFIIFFYQSGRNIVGNISVSDISILKIVC